MRAGHDEFSITGESTLLPLCPVTRGGGGEVMSISTRNHSEDIDYNRKSDATSKRLGVKIPFN